MPQGKITKLVSDRGFGFIAGERRRGLLSSFVGSRTRLRQPSGRPVREYELESEGGSRGKGPAPPQ